MQRIRLQIRVFYLFHGIPTGQESKVGIGLRALKTAHEKTTDREFSVGRQLWFKQQKSGLEFFSFLLAGLRRSRPASVIRFFQFALCLGHDWLLIKDVPLEGQKVSKLIGSSIVDVLTLFRKATRDGNTVIVAKLPRSGQFGRRSESQPRFEASLLSSRSKKTDSADGQPSPF